MTNKMGLLILESEVFGNPLLAMQIIPPLITLGRDHLLLAHQKGCHLQFCRQLTFALILAELQVEGKKRNCLLSNPFLFVTLA